MAYDDILTDEEVLVPTGWAGITPVSKERGRGVLSALKNMPGDFLGLGGDVLDVRHNVLQRAIGKRGENLAPLGAGASARNSIYQLLYGRNPDETYISEPATDVEEIYKHLSSFANPFYFISPTALLKKMRLV